MSFDTLIHKIFFRWGLIVHNYKFFFLILPLLLTTFLSYGFVWLKEQTTIDPQYVFSPDDATWRKEYGALKEHWPLDETRFYPGKNYDLHGYIDVIIAVKKDSNNRRPNILTKKNIMEVHNINNFIIYNLTVPIEHDGKIYQATYTDLCMTYDWKCFLNDHIDVLLPKEQHLGTFQGEIRKFAEEIFNTELKITYPIGWRGTEPIYFGALIGGPHLIDDEGHFNYAKAIRLTYNVREENVGNVSYVWRKRVASFLANKNMDKNEVLEFGLYHNESLPEGLQQVADTLTPQFVLMSTMLFVVCMLCSIVIYNHKKVFGIDWVRSKPLVGFAGILCPLLATASSWGLALWCGEYYNAIVNISPFIIICIGIDDLFIMMTAWHRTNPDLSTARRMGETLSEAAVAITITSATDMLTFGIGISTSLPGVRLFCLYTFWGVTFTYIYQITFFTALMGYAGDLETQGLHSMIFKKAISFDKANTIGKRIFLAGSISRKESHQKIRRIPNQKLDHISVCESQKSLPPPIQESKIVKLKKSISKYFSKFETAYDTSDEFINSHPETDTFVSKFFRKIYGPILIHPKSKKYVLGMYLVYILTALFGCTQIKEGLNPKNLILGDFYLAKFYELIEETFWEEGLQVQVVLNNPPNFFNATEKKLFDEMLNEFEDTPYTMRHNATMLFLPSFEAKMNEDYELLNIPYPNSTKEWYSRCREWVISSGGRKLWEKDMHWKSNNESSEDYFNLIAIRFQIGLKNYKTPTDHTFSCKMMRDIASKYPTFNITTFHEYYPFADQYLELKPALIRNCLLAVACMLIVSIIMIPNYGAAYILVYAIISIDIGVLGYMALWNINLESVSMITVIMSIGFSVDLSAHIVYAYVCSEGNSNKKAITALETLGWPVFLGAFTTILGIMTLAFVDAHIVKIFFKVTFLVITFSMIHGLIFLPTTLIVFLPSHGHDNTSGKNSIHPLDKIHDLVYQIKNDEKKENRQNNEEFDSESIDSYKLTEININARLSSSIKDLSNNTN
uniref:SSD domain-containing protein n=1 Tax=Strongyloides stercoralis TaxID=6248 RepID=A0A0K0E5K2_STRER